MSRDNLQQIKTCDSLSTPNWYAELFRKVHWDYANPVFLKEIGKEFKPDTFIATLKKAKVQAINFFPKDWLGHSYYPSRIGGKHPNLKRNLLKEITHVCHENNIKVMFHYNFVDVYTAKLHPEWRTVEGYEIFKDSDFPKDNWSQWYLCFNSPCLEEAIIPRTEELVKEFHPDGFFLDIVAQIMLNPCYCERCQSMFQKHCGKPIPERQGDPLWSVWFAWRKGVIVQFQERFFSAIHRIDPKILVGSNYAYSTRWPESVPEYIDYLTLDVIEIEQTALWCSFEARYWATSKKPFDIMNTRFLYWWGDWMLKPVVSLKQECATIMANGGRCFIGDKMYPDGTVNEEVFKSIGEAHKFIKVREKFCREAEVVPYIGILHSSSTFFQRVSEMLPRVPHGVMGMLANIRGAHKALVENNFHFNILNEFTLLESISSYRVLVLPEQSIISDEVAEALKKFVEDGGNLLISYLTHPLLFKIAGVEHKGESRYPLGYIMVKDKKIKKRTGDFPIMTHGRFLLVKPTSAKEVCILKDPVWYDESLDPVPCGPQGKDSGYPAVTLNQFGKGRVVYVSGEIFNAYWKKNNPHLKYLIKGLVELLTTDKMIEVKAPPCIEVSLFSQGSRKILHLVNFHTEKVISGISFAEHLPPVYGVRVRLKVDGKVREVRQQPENKRLIYKRSGSYILFEVPQVKIHTMVVVEY